MLGSIGKLSGRIRAVCESVESVLKKKGYDGKHLQKRLTVSRF